MNDETLLPQPPLSAKMLAALSAGLFWLVPFSPFLAIAAVKATGKTAGWPRRVAQTAAVMTTVWVSLMACAVAWIIYVIIWNPSIA